MPEPSLPAEVDVALQQVAQDVRDWADGKGSKPGGWLLEWSARMFKRPEVDWRRVFAKEIRAAVATARERTDWKFGPPSCRRAVLQQSMGDEAPMLPVLRGPEPNVALVVDVSGSMHQGRIRRALSEALAIVQSTRAPVIGLAVDTQVQVVRKIRNIDDVLALNKGGGDTDMRAGVLAAVGSRPTPDVIVVLTDGITDWWGPRDGGKSRVVTVFINDDHEYFDEAPAHVRRHAIQVKEVAR